jgi:hypothetical protein
VKNMPARDKTGPLGQGPFTGQRGGNPPPRLGRNFASGFGFGQGFGLGRGRFGFSPFRFGWNQKPTKKDLESYKKDLLSSHQEELDQLDQLIQETK